MSSKMNKKIKREFKEQFDDEDVIFMFRKHPIVMRKGLVFGTFGPLLGILPAFFFPTLGFGWFYGGLAAGMVLGFLIFLPGYIAWYFSVYIVTDQRLLQITQRGLFRRSIVDLSLSQIQSLNYEVNGLQATLLGYGTIIVQTFMGDLVIHEVHHPAKIYKELGLVLREQDITPQALDQSDQQPINEED